MAAVEQIGTDLNQGAGTITGSYIVLSRRINGRDVRFQDIADEDGRLETRIIFHRHDKLELELVVGAGITDANLATDWPVGDTAGHTDFTDYYVENAEVSQAEGAHMLNVSLIDLGIT